MVRRHHIALLGLLAAAVIAVLFYPGLLQRPPATSRDTLHVTRFTLANGLEVVVMPNTRIPAVAHLLMVKAGAADDPYGKTGLAHYLEHLMFTGTPRYPEGAYERAVVAAGGKQNAYTSADLTNYYTLIARDKLPQVMAMEADRLQHLALDPKRVARELKVITEERRMRVGNDPFALLMEQLDAVTFLNHPYGRPLIGWPDDMAGLSAEDAVHYFKTHYVPANMLLLVAGDVTVGEVRRLAQHYYGALEGGPAPPRAWPKEPVHHLALTASMADAKVREKRLVRQYLAPSVNAGNTALVVPLSVLVEYLGGGQTGLLYRRLVLERKLATALSADYDELGLGPSTVRMVVTPAAGVELPQLKAALDEVIEEARRQPPGPDDLARAKAGLKASVIFAQDGLLPLAQLMGRILMAGKDERYFYDWPGHVEAVTAEEVQHAAQAVLDPSRRVTGYLLPASVTGGADAD